MREVKPCGTRAASLRHRRRGEPVCDACLAGAAADNRARRARQREREEGRRRLAELVTREVVDDIPLTGGRWVRRGLIHVYVNDDEETEAA